MRIAVVTTDNRDRLRTYDAVTPLFGPAPEALLQGFALLPEVEVHVVVCARAPMRSPEKVAPNVFFHCLLVPKIGWMRTLFQGCIRAVRKKLKGIQPKVVHGQGTEGHYALSAVFSGFPNVITLHGNMRSLAKLLKPRPFSYDWLAARLEGFAIPRSQGVVCLTRYTQNAVADLARRTWVVPNAVDPAFFEIAATPPPDKTPRILCVGLICPWKNQIAFIRALDSLAANHRFEVVFLGHASPGRPYDDEFLNLVESRSWCLHAGYANREKLKEYLCGATLLALPSLEDNCPMVVLEAMAAGVPVVAAEIGGVPDLIEDGETGFLCDPHDGRSICAVIEKALVNRARMLEIARLARLQARERFHPRVVARRHIEIYRELLENGPMERAGCSHSDAG
jgi:glycosyltransferase involved in cell wall biosynthesis